jgi:AcrR family transcriptional regulator
LKPGKPESARGRPRDPEIDLAVIEATLHLLEQVGFADTTVQAVARRAGVGVPAVYRRWRNRIELIESAIFHSFKDTTIDPSHDLARDLQRFVDLYTARFATPAARSAVPALLSIYQSAPMQNRSVSERVGVEVRASFHRVLGAAGPELVDPGVDPDDILDMLIGSVLYRVFLRPFTGRADRDDHTTELVLRALHPKTCRHHHARP